MGTTADIVLPVKETKTIGKKDNNRKRQNVGLVSLHHVINNDTISVS